MSPPIARPNTPSARLHPVPNIFPPHSATHIAIPMISDIDNPNRPRTPPNTSPPEPTSHGEAYIARNDGAYLRHEASPTRRKGRGMTQRERETRRKHSALKKGYERKQDDEGWTTTDRSVRASTQTNHSDARVPMIAETEEAGVERGPKRKYGGLGEEDKGEEKMKGQGLGMGMGISRRRRSEFRMLGVGLERNHPPIHSHHLIRDIPRLDHPRNRISNLFWCA
jgi:hypothetical protein